MKSIKVLALIIGAIALLPAASFADTVSGNTQEANLDTVVVGNGNSIKTTTKQFSTNRQKSSRHGESVSGNSQLINAGSTTIGDLNHVKQKAIQTYGNYQRTK
jgi:hypothetical protein